MYDFVVQHYHQQFHTPKPTCGSSSRHTPEVRIESGMLDPHAASITYERALRALQALRGISK
jgi:hypothetical protein